MSDVIGDLIGLGADAMSNMYEVNFVPPTGVGPDVSNQCTLRVKGFTPPAPSAVTYPVHWKTVSITKVASKIEFDRTFDLEFRIDSNYNVYKMMLAWEALTKNPTDGGVNTDIPLGGIVTVTPLVGNITSETSITTPTADSISWLYQDVWIDSITPPSYNTEDATALSITVKFRFNSYVGPV